MENGIFRTFQQIAARLTSDPQLQKDLMQEMYVHLLEARHRSAGQPVETYVNDCEQHARKYLERARNRGCSTAAVGSATRGMIAPLAGDQVELVRPRLSSRQQQVFEWLRRGYGIRATARELGISHPAVIKHRNKITRALEKLEQERGIPPGTGNNNGLRIHSVLLNVC